MQTWHIHIEGRVQGVGFRPFIYRLAREAKLSGTVANTPNGVHIYVNTTKIEVQNFIENVWTKAPSAAFIINIGLEPHTEKTFNDFTIVESTNTVKPKLCITPDIALCADCRQELQDRNNRRYNYAFTTCTQCGPRFSIMEQLPYDRETTTMEPFKMCNACADEYANVEDKRFYSQTNSCTDCGVQLSWLTKEKKHEDPIEHVVALLIKGKIVAVKGVGGFLLLADATNHKAIKKLRKRKNRPFKPFACLFKSVKHVGKYTKITSQEKELLKSQAAPIVLIKTKNKKRDLAMRQIAPGLKRVGAMLPYAPILELIARKIRVPLVATSANASGSPIVYKDDEALRLLGGIADAILTNNRKITFPQDDSVVAVSPIHGKKIILRRSRGYAPSANFLENQLPNNLLAMGAEMKSAFGFTTAGNTYLSQYLGDTASYESQEAFKYTFNNLLEIMKPKIEGVVVDKHPDFHTTQKGIEWAKEKGINVCKAQHHKAHFAAVMAEHNLMEQSNPVLGVVWDGTGYGDDGNMWGGEFFAYANKKIDRVHHLGYMPIISNNRMAYEPPVATLSALWPATPGKVWMRKTFTEQEQLLLPEVAKNAKLFTSSVGRLFDAVAGLLNIKRFNTYEGESALALQTMAEKSKLNLWQPYCLALNGNSLEAPYLLQNLDRDYKNKKPVEDLALRFHQTLVQWIQFVSDTQLINKIAFSGGVFQNTLLVDLIIERLGKNHDLYFHNILPPNDENIAIGQLAIAKLKNARGKKKSEFINEKIIVCV